MIKTLLSYFKPHRRLFALDMACAIAVSAVDIAFPLVSRECMYDLLPGQMYETFFLILAIVIAAYAIRSGCYYIMTYIGHTFGILVETDIRADLFAHLQKLDFSFYDKNRTGKLMSRMTSDLFQFTELAHHGPEDLVIAILTITGSLICMFQIEWRLALVVAVVIPIFLAIVIKTRRSMAFASSQVKVRMADINADIESCLSGMKTSRAFAREEEDRNLFSVSNDNYRKAKSGYYRAMGTFMAAQEFFMCILPVMVIGFGGYLIMHGQMNYVDLITFTLFVTTFITPVRKLTQFAEIFADGMAGLRRFQEIMATEPKIRDAADARPLTVREGEICLDHVSFSYLQGHPVLRDICLQIHPGEMLAIVGQSGGGKTTLCQLIPRFYEVSSGSIRIDGTDIRTVTGRSLHESIGIVQQDVFIYADTILNNIRCGKPDASLEEVMEAARQAEIYEDIMAMPGQFDTYVGERGTMLSGGQKQRLSIARIFLKNPRILILDEATSALDTITEQKIQSAFDKLASGRTTIVIAHRLATIKNADRIVLVENGQISEEGTHRQLMDRNGTYARLYNTQRLLEG